MTTIIEVELRQIYGTYRVYPMNPLAKSLVDLLGRKTFTKDEISKLKAMGFTVKWVSSLPSELL